ncbi:MAG: ATPase, partial [Oscillospiraceae bacterium]
MLFLIPLLIVALLATPLIGVYKGIITGKKSKYAVIFNLCSFVAICILGVALPLSGLVSADEVAAVTEATANS